MTNGHSWSCWVVCLLPFIILLFSHPCWWPIIAKNWCQINIHQTCRKIPTNLESTQTWSTYDTRGPCKPSNPGFPARRLASWGQKTMVEAMEKYQTKTWLVVYLPSWELTYPLSRHFWVDDVPFFHHVGFLVFRKLSIFGLTCNHFRCIHLHPTGTASRVVFPAGTKEWRYRMVACKNGKVHWIQFWPVFIEVLHTHPWQLFPSNSHRILDWLASRYHKNRTEISDM